MLIVKVLETRIDLHDINDMFCADYNKNILEKLKIQYVGKCFKSVLILDILKIIRRSSPMSKNKVLDGSVYIDISFEVSGVVYEKEEVIHNCSIIQINDNGTMHAKSDHASIYIKNSKELADLLIFKKMDKIPVIVMASRYQIYDTEISISAVPLIPILKKSIIYKIVDYADKSDKSDDSDKYDYSDKNIKKIVDLDSIKMLESDLLKASKNKTIYNSFRKLLYPLKEYKKVKTGSVKNISVEGFSGLKVGDLVYKPIDYLDDATFLILGNNHKIEGIELEIEKSELEIKLFNDYYKNMITLLDFCQVYDTADKVKELNKVWSLFNSLKHA
jgi:DNA-directed RNA polymerase subunit E'/Rpb7